MGDRVVGSIDNHEHVFMAEMHAVGRCSDCANNRTLALNFHPEAYVSSVSKATMQRSECWKGVLYQYEYVIMHAACEVFCWGGILS